MRGMTARRFTALVLAPLVAVSLAACSDSDSDDGGATPTSAAGGSQALPPVMVGTDVLEGTTVQVPITNTIVINAENPTNWTGTVSDTSIATFVPGHDDGSATFNPAIKPLKAGTTTVTITNGSTTINFTVQVNG